MVGSSPAVSVLFVCLGNHCRSPAALGVANSVLAGDTYATFDCAGTGRAHVGDAPHPLAVAEGARRGHLVDHRGRQIHPDDFTRFDLILALDAMNVDDLERMRGGVEQRVGYYATVEPLQVQLLRRWDPYAMPGDEDLPDPWGQEPEAYRRMYDVLERTMPPLLEHLAWLHADHPGT